MVQQAFSSDTGNKIISRVKVGMTVFDSKDRRIGKVEDVYFGASSPTANERGTGSASAPEQDTGGDNLYQDIVRAFSADNLPEELRKRLLVEGYIRIGGEGLFGTARYILPGQVSSVFEDHVMLKVNRDDLIKS